jgi:predicted anti-sigma-YlaC factor YlaD
MTMTCHDAESLLHDALDAPLPPADAAALAAHLETCAACRDLRPTWPWWATPARALDRPIVPAAMWTRLSTQLERDGLIARAAATPRTSWRGYVLMAGGGHAARRRRRDAALARLRAGDARDPDRGRAAAGRARQRP